MSTSANEHPEYAEFARARESLRGHAGDVPLLYTWAMDMLQDLETVLSGTALLRGQIDIVGEASIEQLDHRLWGADYESVVTKHRRKKSFSQLIDKALADFPVADDAVVSAFRNRDFLVLDRGALTSIASLFHLARDLRNHLAHDFFVENSYICLLKLCP